MEVNKKYMIIGGVAAIVLLGALYYYSDDMITIFEYKTTKETIKDYSKKKIKSKPLKINIENLNEL